MRVSVHIHLIEPGEGNGKTKLGFGKERTSTGDGFQLNISLLLSAAPLVDGAR